MTPKHEQIRKYLLQGNQITGLIAMGRFNVYRLSSVINRLRNKGLNITTTMENSKKGSYAVYKVK